MNKLRVGVVGASGYSGAVAARLIATHPRLSLAFATSDKMAGDDLAHHLGVRVEGGLRFAPNASAAESVDACDAVVLATSAEVSMRLLPAFADRAKQVVDLSGAFRLDAKDYPRWYGFAHDSPRWLDVAHYGLPELFGPPPQASVVSNPGCYPTAALLALAPLLRAGLIDASAVIVDGKSGVTGAGRQSGDAYSFAEVDEDLRAYKVFAHQHTPEIARGLAKAAKATRVTFTAHLLPVKRGLLVTCYGRPGPGATAARVAECLRDAYAKTPFVHAMSPDQVMLKRVAGTNFCHVGGTADDEVVVAVGALDNLVKGAAGQAVQNLNLMNGWDETTGLDALQRIAP